MNKTREFQKLERIGGILLFTAAALALVLANSPFSYYYNCIVELSSGVHIGKFSLSKPLALWINDALMALYFLLIGLEIKREYKRGILKSHTAIKVPLVAALCGLILPATIYYIMTKNHPEYINGWAIPTATDIAFTLSVLSLVKHRVPFSLKVMLTTIAIFDDMAAIIIIACFYTASLSYISLFSAAVIMSLLVFLNWRGVNKPSIYVFVGILLWLAVLKSGVHATLAGVVLAMAIPDEASDSTLNRLEHALHPWVVFFILPLFAFVNAGVSLNELSLSSLTHPVFLGVTIGLIVGKQIGVFIPLFLCYGQIKTLAKDITMRHLYGISLLCGVGFTMSLFINSLAFTQEQSYAISIAKIAILSGSTISGVLGYLILRR